MSKVCYVGPTITGVAIRNAIYEELPEALEAAIGLRPYLRGLCVPINRLSDAMGQIDREQGGVYTLYKRALSEGAEIAKGVK